MTVTRVGGIFLLGDIHSVFEPIETLLSIYIYSLILLLIIIIIVILTILFILVAIISFYDFILYSYLLDLCLLLSVCHGVTAQLQVNSDPLYTRRII
jgi:hypothetical protein